MTVTDPKEIFGANPQQDFEVLRQIEGGILLPYQQRWVSDDAAVKVSEKSRRTGFSWGEASDCSLHASKRKGSHVWYIGYGKDMAWTFIQDCAMWARAYQLAADAVGEEVIADGDKEIHTFYIEFKSGWRITALSSCPRNLRSKQGIFVFDEAAFHDDFEGMLKAGLALLMWGGKLRIISTHFGEDNPFNDLVQEIRAGKKSFSLHRVTLDDALAEGLYQRICLVLGREWSLEAQEIWRANLIRDYGDAADEELFCIPSGSSGNYFTRALVLSCMDSEIPVLRWKCSTAFAQESKEIREAAALDWCREHLDPVLGKINPNHRVFFGEDFGRTGDLSVIRPAIEEQRLRYRSLCEIELRNVPFEQQRQILFYFLDRVPWFACGAMDARGNGQYLAEVAMQRYGVTRILQVMPTPKWYLEAMPKYKAHLEDKTMTLAKDSDILADHRLVRMERGIPKVPDTIRTKGADGGQRHGDAAIAGAMLTYAIEQGAPWVPEFEAASEVGREFTKMDNYLR